MADTTYDIKVNYLLNDRASRGIASIAQEAKKGARGIDLLTKGFGLLAAGTGIVAGLRMAKTYLVDFNSSIEQSKIQMQGLLQMNMGGDWSRNQQRANYLIEKYQADAKASVGTTKDFVDMGAQLVGPLSRAGASIEEIRDVTKGAVVASRSFGVEATAAALDIQSALAGTLAGKDRFARALLEPMGYTTEKWNEMVKKTPALAAKMLTDAFHQPALLKMAKEQEKSWDGITSTLEDNLQRAFGKIGLPLMQKISAELQHINEWFDKNPKKVQEIVDNIAGAFVKAFDMAKSIFGFIVEHKTLLLTIAKAVLISKGVGMLGQGLGGIAGLLKDFGSGLGGGGLAGGITGFATKLGNASIALGAFAIAAQAGADLILAKQEKRIERQADFGGLKEQARILGGSSVGSGTGISANQASQLRAKQLGYISDFGARGPATRFSGASDLQSSMSDAGARERQSALDHGYLTAADKLMAKNVLRDARAGGILKGTHVKNLGQIAGMFGADNDKFKTMRGVGMIKESMPISKIADVMEYQNRMANDENVKAMTQFLRGLDRSLSVNGEHLKEMGQILLNTGKSIVSPLAGIASMFGFGPKSPTADVSKDAKKTTPKNETNVHINTIQVVSEDPDKFAFNVVGAFQNYSKSPTQAKNAINAR